MKADTLNDWPPMQWPPETPWPQETPWTLEIEWPPETPWTLEIGWPEGTPWPASEGWTDGQGAELPPHPPQKADFSDAYKKERGSKKSDLSEGI